MNKAILFLLLLLILFFIIWNFTSVSSTNQDLECVEELKKKVQTYKDFFKALNGRDMTPEEWEAKTKFLDIDRILHELNIK